MQKIFFRQQLNDGIGGRIKDPQIIAKQNLMHDDKNRMEGEEAEQSKQNRRDKNYDTADFQKAEIVVLFFAARNRDQKKNRNGADQINGVENLTHLRKMLNAGGGGGERRKLERTGKERKARPDQVIIIEQDFFSAVAGCLGKIQKVEVKEIERAKEKDKEQSKPDQRKQK